MNISCYELSAPPPPPPLLTNNVPQKINKSTSSHDEVIKQICSSLQNLSRKTWIFYRHVDALLQDGPQCGLVALGMAAQLFSHDVPVDSILDFAKKAGYTKQGEVFSADNMACLAGTCLDCESQVVRNAFQGDPNTFLGHVFEGKVVLVPYDADYNHYPCCKRGHKAHWALIVGVAIITDASENLVTCNASIVHENIALLNSSSDWRSFETQMKIDAENILVISRHGKSRYVGIWKYKDLQLSNENLVEIDPVRESNCQDYVFPENGIEKELRGCIVVLRNK